MSASESKYAVVLELAEEFLDRYRKGERPPLKEYLDRHPDLAAEIREVFPAMAMMENIALADESLDAPGARATGLAAPLEQLGDYRIIREVGHGGMGIVYEAEQVSLGRHVALKVLPRKMLLDAKQKRRFEREAKAAAKLHHTNIVPVFGVGEHEGMPYYVMQFIQGRGLDEVIDELSRIQGNIASPGRSAGFSPSSPNGLKPALRTPPKEVSAAEVARSLLTGAFEPAAAVTTDEPAGDPSPAATRPPVLPPKAERWILQFSLPPRSFSQGKARAVTVD
jgi:hypothetical protein